MDWGAIILAAIAVLPATVAAIGAFYQSRKTHTIVNSRMTELLAATREASEAKGVAKQKAKR